MNDLNSRWPNKYLKFKELRLIDSTKCYELIKFKNSHKSLKIKNIILNFSLPINSTREGYLY